MDFVEQENIEGVRFSWNCWPCNRIEAARVVVPLSVVATPLRNLITLPVLQYEPVRCRKCNGVLNPYCQSDFYTKIWICPFCLFRNSYPAHYSQINETLLPAELYGQHPVVEYVQSAAVPGPPLFLFVLDIALGAEEAQHLRTAMTQALSLLPDNAFVGLITFGSLVYVHDLSSFGMPRAFVLPGHREVSGKEVSELLGVTSSLARRGSVLGGLPCARGSGGAVFITPLAECDLTLENILEEIKPEGCVRQKHHRCVRCTGAAIAAAVGLMEACAFGMGGRVMVLTAGPATVGPGIIVGLDMAEPIRTHKDFDKGEAKYYKKSCKFYNSIAQRLATNGQCLDVFACSLDQVGLAEMQCAVQRTGGMMVMAEEFAHGIFRQSLARLFERDGEGNLNMAFSGTLEVQCSQGIRVEGAIGSIASLNRKGPLVSDIQTGVGGTTAWTLCALDRHSAVSLFFEVTRQQNMPENTDAALYIQITLQYLHPSGTQRLRVMSLARRWAAPGAPEIGLGFDQETAAVVMARLAAFKCEAEEAFDVLRWIDRTLIRLAARYGEYRKEDPSSFTLPEHFSLYPQFMFHIRRSQFLQVFNNTPDETAFYRLMLAREGVGNGVIMICPMLMSYGLDGAPTPALLDSSSIQPDRILLCDDFFHIIIVYGTTIAQWRDAGYHTQAGYENFRDLLLAPMSDAQELCRERLPVPRIIASDQGKSQSRFLLAKVNPSATHASGDAGTGEVIFTDDVSLQVFLEHLAKLSVHD